MTIIRLVPLLMALAACATEQPIGSGMSERVNISGNTRTEEKILRRELPM